MMIFADTTPMLSSRRHLRHSGLQTLRRRGVTGLVQIKNASGHGIDVAGHEFMEAVFGEFKASLSEKAPAPSTAQRNFEQFVRSRLLEAELSKRGAWQATPAQIKVAAEEFLAELRAGGIPNGYVVEITRLGKIRYRVVIRKWH